MNSLIQDLTLEAGPVILSGLQARPRSRSARGLILALHGGGYSAGYWSCPADRGRLSLLNLASEEGYHVLAVDRPGYGAAEKFDPSRLTLASQIEFLFQGLARWKRENSFDGPVFVIGHSIGGILALLMAAHPSSGALDSVDVLGAPLRFAANEAGEEVNAFPTEGTHVPLINQATHRAILFGPPGASPEVFDYDETLRRPMPVAEYRDAIAAPQRWPDVMPAIRVPVQYTLCEYEVMMDTGWDVLDLARAQLANSAHCVVHLLRGAGHNASLQATARAYHLRALAFFEECAAMQKL